MTTPGVLITSAAAKVPLVESFVEAAHARGMRVLVSDLDRDALTAYFADGFVALPRADDPSFVEELRGACARENIALIVPTRDAELPIMASAREALAPTRVLVSSPLAIEICADKRRFADFCAREALACLPHLSLEQARAALPVFIRPVKGAGGRGARKIDAQAELEDIAGDYENYVVNRWVRIWSRSAPQGCMEYTVDLLRDLEGERAIGAVARERLVVVDGESQEGRVVDRPDVVDLAVRAGERLKLIGHNTVQIIESSQGPLLVEINARFGGAANLGVRAGLDSPRRLLALLHDEKWALAAPKIAYGARLRRYKRDLILGADGRPL